MDVSTGPLLSFDLWFIFIILWCLFPKVMLLLGSVCFSPCLWIKIPNRSCCYINILKFLNFTKNWTDNYFWLHAEIEKLVTAMGGIMQMRVSMDVSFVIVKSVLAATYKVGHFVGPSPRIIA